MTITKTYDGKCDTPGCKITRIHKHNVTLPNETKPTLRQLITDRINKLSWLNRSYPQHLNDLPDEELLETYDRLRETNTNLHNQGK